MITREWMVMMARYNAWQNKIQYGLAAGLGDARRREDLGTFFKSIHGTLNHILWADQMWLSRFDACPPARLPGIAESVDLFEVWDDLSAERERFDRLISAWAAGIDPSDLQGDLTWFSAAVGREVTKPRAVLLTHLFNHQTHHRGQVNAMLTRSGLNPGSTDLPFMD